ncbi:MAG: glycoside hydrolase family 15 protein [Pseudolabrys sp.]
MDLDGWIVQQVRRSAAAMEQAISATHLVRYRAAFDQIVRPLPGSVLASPVIADWNPEPDYFFHWLRDSAIAMRAVAELMQGAPSVEERNRWRRHFEDFVRFSLQLNNLDGADLLDKNSYREVTNPECRKFLRDDDDLRALTGEKVFGEPRFNPDGTIDFLRWSRPQFDGPALRALACLRYLEAGGEKTGELARLMKLDLDFTRRHAGKPCIGPWEEPGQSAHHYYVALVQLGALVHGRAWAGVAAREWTAAEDKLRAALDRHWSEKQQAYLPISPEPADGALDAACLLAVWDADLPDGPHSVEDQRVQMTQKAIEDYFTREFPINRGRTAPALGRYCGDRYFGGGAWYPTTLAAAGLCYRLARNPGQDRDALIQRGDAFMATVRDLTPADGALSEQVDRETGKQTSARHLSWSYAAFISAARERSKD